MGNKQTLSLNRPPGHKINRRVRRCLNLIIFISLDLELTREAEGMNDGRSEFRSGWPDERKGDRVTRGRLNSLNTSEKADESYEEGGGKLPRYRKNRKLRTECTTEESLRVG